LDARACGAEPLTSPTRDGRWIARRNRLDDRAALVAGGTDDFLEKGFGHPIGIVVGIDDQ
jgi:hypothetical protein